MSTSLISAVLLIPPCSVILSLLAIWHTIGTARP